MKAKVKLGMGLSSKPNYKRTIQQCLETLEKTHKHLRQAIDLLHDKESISTRKVLNKKNYRHTGNKKHQQQQRKNKEY